MDGKERPLRGRRQWVAGDRWLAAKTRVARLDTRVNDRDTLVVADKRALHRVDREALDVSEGEPECARQMLELLGERDKRHEPVVGIHGDAEALCQEVADGMLAERWYSPGIHVR